MQRHVDDWTEVTAVLAADHAAARAAAAAEDTRARAQGRTPLRHPTYDVATFMARPPPIFRHVFSKKRAGEWAAIKALWAPALETGGTLPDPLDRAARAVVLARRRRAELELVLSEETARLGAFTRGMELRTALGAGRNFAAAAWGVLSKTAHGDPAGRGPDTPLASLRDGDTLIPPGPRYGPALVRQVEDKWAWKHTCLPALMYAVRATDFGSQALPSDPDPFTWVTRWFTLTNLRKQMRKLRPDLAASHEGPHLYPLARASEQVLRLFLGDLEAAVRQGERHASFYKWKLLFLLKKGRDRYDLKSGCRPIVCLSHLLSIEERLLQGEMNERVDPCRGDVNNGYRRGTPLTLTLWPHRWAHELAELMLEPCVAYFGDMVSFFDEIAFGLLDALAAVLRIPDTLIARLNGNASTATFHTVTPNGVIVGGTPKKGVGQGRGCSCPASLPPLELISELTALSAPGMLWFGRRGARAATPTMQACDDTSAARLGPHARHHTELLAAAQFVAGPLVTGLAHGYAHGKTCTHASEPRARCLEPVTAPTPLPCLDGQGEFLLEHTGGRYTLLGYVLAPVLDHELTDQKRAASQAAMQTVNGNTAGVYKEQAVGLTNLIGQGHPLYYNRATLSTTAREVALGHQCRVAHVARAFGAEGVPACLYNLACDAGGEGLLLDGAPAGAALLDDFLRCLAARPRSAQALAVQQMVALYAFTRGYEPTPACASALEYVPDVIDEQLADRYMLERVWALLRDAGAALRRTQAEACGALRADAAGFATPARCASRFLRDCTIVGRPLRPHPRLVAAGINRVIDLFDGAVIHPTTGARTPRLLTAERAFAAYGSADRGITPREPLDAYMLALLLRDVAASPEAMDELRTLALARTRPCLELRLALWAATPAAEAAVNVLAWRPERHPPLLPLYHVLTARDRWAGTEGRWRTAPQLEGELDTLVARATTSHPSDLACCAAARTALPAALAAAASGADPAVHCLPPTLYTAATAALGTDVWRAACSRAPTRAADAARHAATRWFVEEWAPAMAYPWKPQDMHLNATADRGLGLARTWAAPSEVGNYRGAVGPDGKQVLSAIITSTDREAGRRAPGACTLDVAHTIHRAHEVAAGRPEPGPLAPREAAGLFCCPTSPLPAPYAYDAPTLADPLRRPFVQVQRLEAADGRGVQVVGLDGQVVTAHMEKNEREAIDPKQTAIAYDVVTHVASNLPGGCHLFRIGDGSHAPDPRDPSVGLATAYAVVKGPTLYPANAPLPWHNECAFAYGGCLGPGAGINSGEVAAALACLLEAIHIRRTSASASKYFNVIYAIDSASCADEMDGLWQSELLAEVRCSAIQPLVETWCHWRRELHELGGHFVFVKFPGHGGVAPMAAADACAKACLCMQPRPLLLTVHSTLATVVALPPSSAAQVTGATARSAACLWAGTPSPHAVITRYILFFRTRLQRARAARAVSEYCACSAYGGRRLVIDWARAGLVPPWASGATCWSAMLAHFK